jgi:hypothetical protein
MPGQLHDELTDLGARWFKAQGFGIVATELQSAGCAEQPDVVAYRHSCAAIIEVKVSRADFAADARKSHRGEATKGLGLYRFYLCPQGLISPTELPSKWGLLYESDGTVVEVVRPTGNLWSAQGARPEPWNESWLAFQHQPDPCAERSMLYSIARRLAAGKPINRMKKAKG